MTCKRQQQRTNGVHRKGDQVVSVSDKRLLILLPPWPYPFSVARWF